MATLATEYKLYMDDNNIEKAHETLNELYYAVVALNRIDDFAESYHYKNTSYPLVRNGFFLRDDVPLSFLSNFQNATVEGPIAGWYPLYNSGNPIPGQPYEYNFNDINSDFYFKDGAPNTSAPLFYSPENEASQDQVIALLMGFCFIFIYFPTISKSQTEAENLKKYWDYRDRLKKFFLKIGPDAGESIPMENREDGINTSSGKSRVRFGDATIQLGYYIAVLASECKLLTDAQQFDEAQGKNN